MQELSEFRLKCFQLLQSEKGMKVSLDALIFAAAIEKKRQTALEIGAGTGIVSLVLAQDSLTDITAVEIDPYIASICKKNFSNSPFSDRLELFCENFIDYSSRTEQRFELIISNPPFFHGSKQATEKKRNLARHEMEFSYRDIFQASKTLLTENGLIYLLMPFPRKSEILSEALRYGLHLEELTAIKSRPQKEPKTAIFRFSREKSRAKETEIVVYGAQGNTYTKPISSLLKPYLLKL